MVRPIVCVWITQRACEKPMTDQEVIAKFKDMASVRMTETQMNRL